MGQPLNLEFRTKYREVVSATIVTSSGHMRLEHAHLRRERLTFHAVTCPRGLRSRVMDNLCIITSLSRFSYLFLLWTFLYDCKQTCTNKKQPLFLKNLGPRRSPPNANSSDSWENFCRTMNKLCTLHDTRSGASTETTIPKKCKEKIMMEKTDREDHYSSLAWLGTEAGNLRTS